jgi:hypothetical protein
VFVGVAADRDGSARVGVAISRGGRTAVLAPDEARAMAERLEAEGDDPTIVLKLRALADGLPELIRAMGEREPGTRWRVVGPSETGPEALASWTIRHRRLFQAAYRKAIGRGIPPENVVIWGAPSSESMDDPPVALDIIDRADGSLPPEAGPVSARVLAAARSTRPRPGYFNVVASRAEGRFLGIFFGMLPIPAAHGTLPVAPLTPGDEIDN